MNLSLIISARDFAHDAHDKVKQTRKYTGEPYWAHVDEVAAIVAAFSGDENQIAASYLHDTIEDAGITALKLSDLFNNQISLYVLELTDVYTSAAFPTMNRAQRKRAEAQRLGQISNAAKTIKLADLYSNTRLIVAHDKGFAKTYLKEKLYLMPLLVGGNQELWDIVNNQLKESLVLI